MVVQGMLDHQIEFSKGVAEIYKPISGRVSDPTSFEDEGNPEGIRACEEYETIVNELKTTLAPELEMIETRVIRPADELMEVIKAIRKTATKRQHKQLDYDRHKASLKKLQDKKDKTLKDEKAMYKAEADVELATQEFDHYNELLKTELPELFRLEREFIRPLFLSFYYMQLNIFYTLHERMQGINIGYFDLESGIEAAFDKKRGPVQEQTEALAITKFRTQGAKLKLNHTKLRMAKEGGPAGGGGGGDGGAAAGGGGAGGGIVPPPGRPRPASMDSSRMGSSRIIESPPPPYRPSAKPVVPLDTKPTLATPSVGVGRSNSTGGNWGGGASAAAAAAAAKKKPAPPPPKPKPKYLSADAEKATALYDFEAQADGDLSFAAGDVVEIVQRTGNANEWWTGKVHGRTGQFPGNYVELN